MLPGKRTGKSKTLPVTKSRTTKHYPYKLHGHTLESVTSAKYLGVTIRHDLSWDDHITGVVNKANRTLGFLRRNLKISSRNIKERAYKAFVRPLLEYASSIWDPHTKKAVGKLEMVQRRAARFVLNRYRNTSSVSNMIDILGWQSLEERRRIQRLTLLYKIRGGLVHCPDLERKLIPSASRQRRGCVHNHQLQTITSNKQYRNASFLPRTIKEWNNLPKEIVEAKTVDTFVYHIGH